LQPRAQIEIQWIAGPAPNGQQTQGSQEQEASLHKFGKMSAF
jgi:hypothetical protein